MGWKRLLKINRWMPFEPIQIQCPQVVTNKMKLSPSIMVLYPIYFLTLSIRFTTQMSPEESLPASHSLPFYLISWGLKCEPRYPIQQVMERHSPSGTHILGHSLDFLLLLNSPVLSLIHVPQLHSALISCGTYSLLEIYRTLVSQYRIIQYNLCLHLYGSFKGALLEGEAGDVLFSP